MATVNLSSNKAVLSGEMFPTHLPLGIAPRVVHFYDVRREFVHCTCRLGDGPFPSGEVLPVRLGFIRVYDQHTFSSYGVSDTECPAVLCFWVGSRLCRVQRLDVVIRAMGSSGLPRRSLVGHHI